MSRVAHPAGPRHGDVLPADHPPAAPQDLNALPAGIWPRGAGRSGGGALTLGGIDVRDLAAEFGTPLYVCDEEDVRSRCREYLDAFGPEGRVFYAAKAFCSRAVLRWVSSEGLGVDVCTGGELEVALSAGVPPERITMHGNNKMLEELSRAVEAGIGHIVVDSFEEIARLAYLTEDAGTKPNVLVRVTTGVEAHTHEFMATAHDDQKFGFSLASGAADEAVRRVIACPGVTFAGLHSHIGSQIFDTAGFEVAAHRVVGLAVRIRDEHGVEIAELDLGGGFGIAYTTEDDAPEVKELAQSLRDIVDGQCRAAGLSRPRLTVEPGRGIVGPSTVSLYTVGTIKDVDGIRTYVSVDGGMSDNIRTALYDASYECVLASRTSAAAPVLSRVVGRHCESGDIVVRHAWLPSDLAPGDLLAVPATGAYCRSLASNYNHVARPAVVAVSAGGGPGASGGRRAARPIIRRETLDDLLSLDIG
jgi:diaminopimelate decarboxylase